ncbi:MAG TPA: DUF1572 family protein [Gemmatimonadaceae bacterium]|jgi:hypothetical protein
MFVQDFIDEYAGYRKTGEKALAQVSDEALNRVVAPNGNSIAMIVRHLGGNLQSRFTNFQTEDGEKPWRDRDAEFADRSYTRAEVDEQWTAGWTVLEHALNDIGEDDLSSTVKIRGETHTIHEALVRSLAHTAMHVGQIVLLARIVATDEWKWISIPKGESKAYNQNPTSRKGR